MVYWLVALPSDSSSSEGTWSSLQEETTYGADLSVNFKFAVPDFRVGTLDTLLGLSDDLVKVNGAVEGTVNKIRRQLFELQRVAPGAAAEEDEDEPATAADDAGTDVAVEGSSPQDYLQHFVWQEAKFPVKRALKDTVAAITEVVQKLDDDLKLRTTEYSQQRTQLQASLRRQTGSLAVRDLSDLVPRSQVVDTENLQTVLVVVNRSAAPEFLKSYETLCDYVVPRSAGPVTEDAEYAVFSVVVFRRVADDFRAAARGHGYQVKDVKADPEAIAAARDALEGLKRAVERRRAEFEAWCGAAYSEAFSAWIHVLAVRLFVEAILRYGLPPQYLPVLMRPNPKTTAKLRKLLASRYAGVGSKHFSADGGGEGGDLFPYVSFTLNIEEH